MNINNKILTICFNKNICKLQNKSKFKVKFMLKQFCDKKENLEHIKNSLSKEKKSVIEKFSDFFRAKKEDNKNDFVNHSSLNEKEIEKIKLNAEKIKNEKKTINDFFDFSKKLFSKTKIIEETSIEELNEKFKKITNMQLFFKDSKFNMFKDDIYFLLTSSQNPKIIIKLLNFSVIFLNKNHSDLKENFSEFCEQLFNKVNSLIEEIEISDFIIFLDFFHYSKQIEKFNSLSEIFKWEILRRISKDKFYKISLTSPYIDNEDFPKIILLLDKAESLDSEILSQIFNYVIENIDTFSIKELLNICLALPEKGKYYQTFIKFFNDLYEKKLRRNIKHLSADNLIDLTNLFHRYNFLFEKNENFKIIIETLLQNNSVNKEINNTFLFTYDKKIIVKFVSIINSITEIKKYKENVNKNKDIIELFFKNSCEFFIFNKSFFTVEDILILTTIFCKRNLLDNQTMEILTNDIIEKVASFSYENFSKFCFFFVNNPKLEIKPKLRKKFTEILESTNDINIWIEIIHLYIRRDFDSEVNENNFKILEKFFPEKSNLNIRNNILLLWNLSYFHICNKENKEFKLDENIIKEVCEDIQNNSSFDPFQLIMIIHLSHNFYSYKQNDSNFQQNFNNLLNYIQNDIINNIKKFSLIEFITIFTTYINRQIGSNKLIDSFIDIIINSIQQFNLMHLNLIIQMLEICFKEYNFVDKKNIVKCLEIMKRCKIIQETKNIENNVNEIDNEIIKEFINEYIYKSKSNDYQKLI